MRRYSMNILHNLYLFPQNPVWFCKTDRVIGTHLPCKEISTDATC